MSTGTPHDELMPEGEENPPKGVRTMAIVRWAIVVTMGLVATLSLLSHFGVSLGHADGADGQIYYCPMHPQIVQDHPGDCPICSMTLVPKPPGPVKPAATMQPATALVDGGAAGKYYCPMHPHVSSDDPNAKCDLCGGMKLVPRPAPPGAEARVPGLVPVDLPPDRVQLIGVRTAKVARESLAGALRTVGVVAPNEKGLAQVSPRVSGWIERLLVQETGVRVSRGQVLATVYSPELLQAQQEFVSALGWAAAASPATAKHAGGIDTSGALVRDARTRLELLGISAQEIDAIARERRPRRAVELRSPVAGHVIVRNAVLGMTVQPGMALFEVADLSTVWVMADVYESNAAGVRVGQPALFQSSALGNEEFKGKVQFIYPNIDSSTRTLRVRLELRNRPGPAGLTLRPGMYGNVTLQLPATDGLVVPSEAVVDTGGLQYVFVDRGGGRFEPRLVKVGGQRGEASVISQGLAVGETVVTTANFLIDSESRLRAAIEGKTTPGDTGSGEKSQGDGASSAPAAMPGHQH
jgi:membrane fusion protein, copper/silver efflux system